MIECVIAIVVYAIIAVILLYVVETLLGLWGALPAQVYVLIRLLAALLLLVYLLGCLGLMPGMSRRLP